MEVRLNKTDRKRYDHLRSTLGKAEAKGDWRRASSITDKLVVFASVMYDKYGIVLPEIDGFAKGGFSKKKTKKSKMNKGGMIDHRSKGLFR